MSCGTSLTDTVGPGAYDVANAKAVVRSQPVVDFGRMRSQRTDFSKATADVPDAGMYQPEVGPPLSARRGSDPLVRPTATFASKTGRKVATGGAVGETPGPGAYKTVSATTAFKTAVRGCR